MALRFPHGPIDSPLGRTYLRLSLESLIDAFEQLGLRVPRDLSVTAICPDELAASVRVPVTSVALPSEEVGSRAVESLMRKLDGKAVPEATLLPPRMTERASAARRALA